MKFPELFRAGFLARTRCSLGDPPPAISARGGSYGGRYVSAIFRRNRSTAFATPRSTQGLLLSPDSSKNCRKRARLIGYPIKQRNQPQEAMVKILATARRAMHNEIREQRDPTAFTPTSASVKAQVKVGPESPRLQELRRRCAALKPQLRIVEAPAPLQEPTLPYPR